MIYHVNVNIMSFVMISIYLFVFPQVASASTGFAQYVPDDAPFMQNFLTPLFTSGVVTEAIAVTSDNSRGYYIVGNIELDLTTPNASLPDIIVDVPEDNLRKADMFIARVLENTTLEWIRRTGTTGTDWVSDVACDSDGNAYVTGYASGRFPGGTRGASILKFDSSGNRIWVKTYGSPSGHENFYAITIVNLNYSTNVNSNSTTVIENIYGEEIVISGSAGQLTELIEEPPTNADNMESLAMILRVNLTDGQMQRASLASGLSGTLASSSNSVAVKFINGSAYAFITGSVTVSINGKRNSAVFSFSYPELNPVDGNFLSSPRIEYFSAAAPSVNDFSLYCVGTTLVSLYEETNARVTRFNSTDLRKGWSLSLGSIRFATGADVQLGQATEIGRGIVVDTAGNLYILIQSTSRLQAFDELHTAAMGADIQNDSLTNMRPAIVVLGPDGTIIDALQSQMEASMTVSSMVMVESVIVVVGFSYNEQLGVTHAVMTSARIQNSTLRVPHGPEFVPILASNADDSDNVDGDGGGTGDGTESKSETTPLWIVLTGAVGGLVFIVVCLSLIVLFIRQRTRKTQLET